MTNGSVTFPATTTQAAPEGHDAAMLARYEAGQAAAAAGTTYVAPVASVPAVAPGVVAPGGVAPAVAPAVPPVAAPAVAPAATPSGDFVDTLLVSAGLTRDSLSKEFVAGGLTADSYAKLAAKGVNKEAVDQYLAGVSAQVTNANAAYETAVITATVGTPEKYAAMVGWASNALTASEVTAFNAAVDSGDQARAAFAVAGLNARFMGANPAEPSLLNLGTPSGGTSGYESLAQMKADMRTPEYSKDPAFREKVRARLAASGNLL